MPIPDRKRLDMSVDEQSPPFVHLEVALSSPFGKTIEAETAFHRLVREVASEYAETVQWLIVNASTNGVIRFRLTPDPLNERIGESTLQGIVHAVVDGVLHLAEHPTRPEFFNDNALEAASELAQLRDEVGSVGIMNGQAGSPITEQFQKNVDELVGAKYDDYGSVEGQIEGVNLHVNRYFNLYDALTGKRVRCNFAHRIEVGEVKRALERRATVWGLISYRADGTPVHVAADGIEVLPDDDALPDVADVVGIFTRTRHAS